MGLLCLFDGLFCNIVVFWHITSAWLPRKLKKIMNSGFFIFYFLVLELSVCFNYGVVVWLLVC
jgi:hypothetical protein